MTHLSLLLHYGYQNIKVRIIPVPIVGVPFMLDGKIIDIFIIGITIWFVLYFFYN
ncbi:hypothetical protein [Rossellomorea arthrocnemi]|uniref:hypothetical protein n=1 Tax=Rossellomorea arthrocnemi TaxID=2769542 RepID=UPI00191AF795|nr:hypothetical protein [Rossellomorea arthrocnemi]